jgi:hypothetical protein
MICVMRTGDLRDDRQDQPPGTAAHHTVDPVICVMTGRINRPEPPHTMRSIR